jgi:hypothetical protein
MRKTALPHAEAGRGGVPVFNIAGLFYPVVRATIKTTGSVENSP